MTTEQNSGGTGRHTGRKVWYGIVIALCALMILISAAGILGSWVVGQALSDVTVQLLITGEQAAGKVEDLAVILERNLADIQDLATLVSETTAQIGENVTDKGVVLTLLPEDRERQLVEKVQTVVDTLTGIRGAVASAIEIYRAVDGIPFVNLPKPATDTVDKLAATVNELQAGVNDLAQAIRDFRANVAGAIDRITTLSDRISSRIEEATQRLQELQALMATLQQRFAELQKSVPVFFTILSLLFSLFFVFILYTQVVVIQLFVRRWRALDAPVISATPTLPPSPEAPGGEPPLPEGGEASD